MTECRTITKYPNRRLYDTYESRYITLVEIRKLVNEGVPFLIVDKRSGADITTEVLFQVVADQEGRAAVLSREFLAELIRARQGIGRQAVELYLASAMKIFMSSPAAAVPERLSESGSKGRSAPASS